MTNDTNTLNGALQELGETLADNLTVKGVSSTYTEGLTTLAGKVLDINSLKDIDVNLNLTGESIIHQGESVLLTSTLTTSYDDTSTTNVDLNGVLSGATVTFKEGSTTVGSDVTDVNGVATTTLSNLSVGYHPIKSYFTGTDYFKASESNVKGITVVVGDYIELEFTGDSFSSYNTTPFTYTGQVVVEWGDGISTEYTGGTLSHTYSSSDDYIIRIYGNITSLNDYCFRGITGLTSVTLPENVTSIGGYVFYRSGVSFVSIPSSVTTIGQFCFSRCNNLTSITIPESVTSIGIQCFEDSTNLSEIVLEWDTSSEIVSYNSNWVNGCTSFDHFLIPDGTTSLYTAKSYPSNLLQEESGPTPVPDSIDLTGTKSILSYADSESTVLTATVLDSSDNPVEGVDVNLYNGATLWDTLTTDSSGEWSKTYSSAGVGDITFTAEVDGTLLTKTFVVEDCPYYNPFTSNANGFTVPSAVSSQSIYGFSNNGWKYGNASGQMPLSTPITNNCSVEFVLTDYSSAMNPTPVLRAYNGSSIVFSLFGQWGANGWWLGSSNTKISSNAPVKGATYRLDITSTSLQLYENDNLIGTVNQSNIASMELRLETGTNRYTELKEFKIKPL